MPILYALVARQRVVLCEYTGEHGGNFPTVTRSLLSKIPTHNEKMSIVYDRHVFHYIVHDNITFLCMAEQAAKRRVPFAFLMDIKNRWRSTFGDSGQTAVAFAMQQEFSKTLQSQMDYFNEVKNDEMDRVQVQLDEVKQVMVENISKVLDRSERIELMVDKTDHLSRTSKRFTNESKELRKAMWWHNMKVFLGVSFCVLFVLAVLILMAYYILRND